MLYTLVGLFKGERFSYGRALILPRHTPSIISSRISYELNCREKLEKLFAVEVLGIGRVLIDSLCAIDKAIVEGGIIEKVTVFYIVNEHLLKKLKCDMIIGLDVISWWGLVIDTASGRVYSVIAKRSTM
ncbi:MAG: hypothetical protein LM572_04665 [Ignisphaera sp.]|jgi:hypothetical protein|nr:hypothetical protein [Ignisphaera sp.]MCC6056720.1 hypothetical protein [Desulfurococcaceae archaeon]